MNSAGSTLGNVVQIVLNSYLCMSVRYGNPRLREDRPGHEARVMYSSYVQVPKTTNSDSKIIFLY